VKEGLSLVFASLPFPFSLPLGRGVRRIGFRGRAALPRAEGELARTLKPSSGRESPSRRHPRPPASTLPPTLAWSPAVTSDKEGRRGEEKSSERIDEEMIAAAVEVGSDQNAAGERGETHAGSSASVSHLIRLPGAHSLPASLSHTTSGSG